PESGRGGGGEGEPTPPPPLSPSPCLPLSACGAVVVLDPGHGGLETGAARASGPRLVEKDVVLDVGLRLAGLLRTGGYRGLMTRDADRQVNTAGRDLNGDGKVDTDDDLQARVDVSNEAGADLFVSLHANGGTPDMRGLSTFYCTACSNAAASRRLASSLHRSVL